MIPSYEYKIVGPRYVRVTFNEAPSRELTGRLVAAAASLTARPGIVEALSGYRSLLIETQGEVDQLLEALPSVLSSPETRVGLEHRLVVYYDGPDLKWVADFLQISTEEIVELHTERSYHVVASASPGFIYLSLTAPALKVPRLDTPRPQVPAGSIGLAGQQTGIYGSERPGGWRLIGRCIEIPRMRPGDLVTVVPA